MTTHDLSVDREVRCSICGGTIIASFATTPDPDCPEMISVRPPVRVGHVSREHGGKVTVIFTCSKSCLRVLLAEGLNG